MRSVIITDEASIEIFLARYLELVKNVPRLELNYFTRARVCAFYLDDDRMVGGFVMNVSLPFRCFASLPAEPVFCAPPPLPEETIEFSCAWLDPALSQVQRIYCIAVALVYTLRSPRKYLMSGTFVESFVPLFTRPLPVVFYRGPFAGMPKEGWLFYGTKASILRSFVAEVPRRIGLAWQRKSRVTPSK